VPVAALDSVALDLSAFGTVPPAPPAADAQRTAIFHRADLLASLAGYAAAESALQLEVAKQYPDIHLGSGYTYDTGTNKIGFGLAGITMPILTGTRAASRKPRRSAGRRQCVPLRCRDRILGDLEHALTRYQASLEALQLSDAHLASARRQLDSQAAAFSSGSTDRLTFTQAKADYQTSETARLDAEVAVQQAAGALEDAMQSPLAPVGHEAVSHTLGERQHDETPTDSSLRHFAGLRLGRGLVHLSGSSRSGSLDNRRCAVVPTVCGANGQRRNGRGRKPEAQRASHIEVAPLATSRASPASSADATVIDLQPLFDLRNRLASARANVDTLTAQAVSSRTQCQGSRTLYADDRNVSLKSLQAALVSDAG
jgi:hypothetical protein